MKTKRHFISIAFLGLAVSGFAQADNFSGAATAQDSTARPSLAQLKAQVLQPTVSATSLITLPSEHRAFFCRFDDKLDKKRIPLRMRLGSLEDVNRMEAKPGYRAGQLPQ